MSRYVKLPEVGAKLASPAGMAPARRLSERSSRWRLERLPRAAGMLPVKMLSERSREVRAERLPSSLGRSPVTPVPVAAAKLRPVTRPPETVTPLQLLIFSAVSEASKPQVRSGWSSATRAFSRESIKFLCTATSASQSSAKSLLEPFTCGLAVRSTKVPSVQSSSSNSRAMLNLKTTFLVSPPEERIGTVNDAEPLALALIS